MFDNDFILDDIETSILIMTQKEDLNSSLLSSLDKAIFTDKFSLVLVGEQFYGYVFCFNDKDLGIYTSPLYNHLDINKEFGRCLIIEWRVCQEVFSVYENNKELHNIGIHCIEEVGSWFFRVAGFYTDMTEKLLDYLYKSNLVKLF